MTPPISGMSATTSNAPLSPASCRRRIAAVTVGTSMVSANAVLMKPNPPPANVQPSAISSWKSRIVTAKLTSAKIQKRDGGVRPSK